MSAHQRARHLQPLSQAWNALQPSRMFKTWVDSIYLHIYPADTEQIAPVALLDRHRKPRVLSRPPKPLDTHPTEAPGLRPISSLLEWLLLWPHPQFHRQQLHLIVILFQETLGLEPCDSCFVLAICALVVCYDYTQVARSFSSTVAFVECNGWARCRPI